MQSSTVILIPLQWSNKSKSCQNWSVSTVFHPRELRVARRVTAGGSIPFVLDSDLRTIISFLWYWVREGMPKKARKRLKRRSWRIVLERRRMLSLMVFIFQIYLAFISATSVPTEISFTFEFCMDWMCVCGLLCNTVSLQPTFRPMQTIWSNVDKDNQQISQGPENFQCY